MSDQANCKQFTDSHLAAIDRAMRYVDSQPIKTLVAAGVIDDDVKPSDFMSAGRAVRNAMKGRDVRVGGTYWIQDAGSPYNSREARVQRFIDDSRVRVAVLPDMVVVTAGVDTLRRVSF